MAYLIVEEDAIGVLSAAELPAAAGGGANPFKDLVEFLDKTRGRWTDQNDFSGGRSAMEAMVTGERGTAFAAGKYMYQSPAFSAPRLPIATIPQAIGLFAAIGLYFELVLFPAFVKIADADYNDDTPDYLPNSRLPILDEDGVQTGTTVVKWSEWKDATHPHLADDGFNYVTLNSNTGGKYGLCGSVIAQLVASGYDVHGMADWPVIEGTI